MRRRRFAYLFACGLIVAGCAATAPPPAEKVDGPIVWAPTAGGCTEPSHKPFPAYEAPVPHTGEPDPKTRGYASYPDDARKAGVQGVVVIAALVCEHGKVVATKVIESIPALDAAVTDAVRQWVFQPAMIQGVTVAAWKRVPYRFSLN